MNDDDLVTLGGIDDWKRLEMENAALRAEVERLLSYRDEVQAERVAELTRLRQENERLKEDIGSQIELDREQTCPECGKAFISIVRDGELACLRTALAAKDAALKRIEALNYGPWQQIAREARNLK